MARWMGVLGRFQVLAGGVVILTAIGIAIAYGATEALARPAATSETTPPLISLGELSVEALAAALGIAFVIGAIALRGGILLIDAAEDFEHLIHATEGDRDHLEHALGRLHAYYVMEALLALAALAATGAWIVTRLS
jgi:hypothetical protein